MRAKLALPMQVCEFVAVTLVTHMIEMLWDSNSEPKGGDLSRLSKHPNYNTSCLHQLQLTKDGLNADSMLSQRLKRWSSIETELTQCQVPTVHPTVSSGVFTCIKGSRLNSTEFCPPTTSMRWNFTPYQPFSRQVIRFKFSPSWSCDSLAWPTTSSEWNLLIFV